MRDVWGGIFVRFKDEKITLFCIENEKSVVFTKTKEEFRNNFY